MCVTRRSFRHSKAIPAGATASLLVCLHVILGSLLQQHAQHACHALICLQMASKLHQSMMGLAVCSPTLQCAPGSAFRGTLSRWQQQHQQWRCQPGWLQQLYDTLPVTQIELDTRYFVTLSVTSILCSNARMILRGEDNGLAPKALQLRSSLMGRCCALRACSSGCPMHMSNNTFASHQSA